MQGGTCTVKFNATRRAVAIVFSRMRKRVFLMNLHADPVRNQLSIPTLSGLIFIKVNGPKPEDYKPDYYVQQGLSTGHQSSTDPATGKKSKKQKRVSPIAFHF